MVHQGKEFGVDLYELEKVAKVDFPTVSADYGDAIGSCNRVRSDLAQVMRRPERFGGDPLGPVYQAYLNLHDTVLGFLNETRANLDDTATALDKAARHYAETDQAARDELYRRAQNDPELGGKL
ncbi:WXG100 family type VII secretion target [Amycolatopsis sp. NPDC003865]